MKILFFIGTLESGGKERRLIELLTYLKKNTDFELKVILAFDKIDYPAFYDLNIEYISLDKKPNNKDFKLFFKLNKIVRDFNPDIIHSWGGMQTFYMIPASILNKSKLINSQIADAPPYIKPLSFINFRNKVNFIFSKIILGNSFAGLKAYRVHNNKKSRVIYNGVNFSRFKNLPDKNIIKEKYNIKTSFAVVMAASFTSHKDYNRFFEVAKKTIEIRNDISFIGVGGCSSDSNMLKSFQEKVRNIDNILFPGRINEVEALINACDIGILFSNDSAHGEGISNSIIEYMSLSKPVIANNNGGTSEILKNNKNGFLINNESIDDISKQIIELIDNEFTRNHLGQKGRELIENNFSIQKMGEEFCKLYNSMCK